MIYFQAQVKLVGSAQHDIKMDEHLGIVIGSLPLIVNDCIYVFVCIFSTWVGGHHSPFGSVCVLVTCLYAEIWIARVGEQARSGSS